MAASSAASCYIIRKKEIPLREKLELWPGVPTCVYQPDPNVLTLLMEEMKAISPTAAYLKGKLKKIKNRKWPTRCKGERHEAVPSRISDLRNLSTNPALGRKNLNHLQNMSSWGRSSGKYHRFPIFTELSHVLYLG